MSKKTSRGAATKISLSAVSSNQNGQKASISKSSFTPSHLQLALFASIIQGLDSQHLRIHDTNTGRLRCDHSAGSGTRITCLDWGYYGVSYRESRKQNQKKKRKRDQPSSENCVIAYGTSNSEICMFSPSEARIVGKLVGAHDRGIRDFKFSTGDYLDAWSIGGDGKLVHWDLRKDQATRSISLPDPRIALLSSPSLNQSQILCASSAPFLIDATSEQAQIFDSFKGPIHSLFTSGSGQNDVGERLLAVDADRYINVYEISQKKLVRCLITGTEVEGLDLFSPDSDAKDAFAHQMLAAVTREGTVELFSQPFDTPPLGVNGDLRSRKKNVSRKADAQVKLAGNDPRAKNLPIFAASLQGPELVVATANGGIEVSFEKVRWQDEATGELLFDGIKEVRARKSISTFNTVSMNGVKDLGKSHVDESRTVVVDGGVAGASKIPVIEIPSSDEEKVTDEESEEDLSDSEEESPEIEGADAQEQIESSENSDSELPDAPMEGVLTVQTEAKDVASAIEVDSDDEEPTFGELVASKGMGVISIADSLQPDVAAVIAVDGSQSLAVPGISLSTVLTQSLRTNDNNLLETCFHNTDTDIIKATIQRLDSSLAGILLQKLAERLSSRPGRYGHLLIWVQWICVAHGGAIASRPDTKSKIRNLYKVLNQRSKSLDNLLLLKGKLDMLEAQLSFRKELQLARGSQKLREDPSVIYIEGHDNWSSDEKDEVPVTSAKKGKQTMRNLDDLIGESESSDDDMPMANGISHLDASEDESEEEEDEVQVPKGDGMIDDEAEESNEDSGLSEEVDDDSDEEEEDEAEDSEMDSFINDDSISEVEDDDDI